MTNDIIDSRGYFWSAEIDFPRDCFAPQQSTTGRFRLRADGFAELDLDASLELANSDDPMKRILHPGGPVKGAICGFLIDAHKHIFLTKLISNGGAFGSISPIRERLTAYRCLVAHDRFKLCPEQQFRWLDIPLDGYEEWTGRGNIHVTESPQGISALYTGKTQPIRWKVGNLSLELHRELRGNGGVALTELSWREIAFLRLGGLKASFTIERAVELLQQIENLIVLLSDHDKRLEFGSLRLYKNSKPIKFYFPRKGRETSDKVLVHRTWVTLDQCKDFFGEVVNNWLRDYKIYGPGFHLYLGNRRGQTMYPEHRFASLMWGLEALHRSLVPEKENPAQKAKVTRILEQISSMKDRKWAQNFLPTKSEPSLANRLFYLFSLLKLDLNKTELTTFTQHCAQRRNDVSHFGGQRHLGGYKDFLEDITKLNKAVDLFYHAVILHVIGVPDWLVKQRFVGGNLDHVAAAILAACGLHIHEHDAD